MEIGMYVRTEKGMIGKITHFTKTEIEFDSLLYYCDYEDCSDKVCYYETPEELEFIKKASFNLIDLIEVGDYVNGHKVYKGDNGVLFLKIPNLDSLEIRTVNLKSADTNRQIINDTKWAKEILTHELFEANCYKVVE